jgi:hypothetical protein
MRMSDVFYAPLAGILLATNRAAGSTWAWRVTRFVHSIPFGLGATGLGYLAGMFWGISPPWSAALCGGGFYVLAARDWFREWRGRA